MTATYQERFTHRSLPDGGFWARASLGVSERSKAAIDGGCVKAA